MIGKNKNKIKPKVPFGKQSQFNLSNLSMIKTCSGLFLFARAMKSVLIVMVIFSLLR